MHIFHKWKVSAIYNRFEPIFKGEVGHVTGELMEGVGANKTDILYKCECGKVKSDSIDGKWTLEQMK